MCLIFCTGETVWPMIRGGLYFINYYTLYSVIKTSVLPADLWQPPRLPTPFYTTSSGMGVGGPFQELCCRPELLLGMRASARYAKINKRWYPASKNYRIRERKENNVGLYVCVCVSWGGENNFNIIP
jgi:hypothetical protein